MDLMEHPPIICWYPGSSISTSDVAAGLHFGLDKLGVKVLPYHAEAEIHLAAVGLTHLWKSRGADPANAPTEADKIYRAGKAFVADAVRARIEHGANWVIVVSGMYQHPDYYVMLRSLGFKLALLCTESPYDLDYELRAAKRVDVVFTNERTCVDAFRTVNPHSYYLAHAWHPGTHEVMGKAYVAEDGVLAHDVVFVGTFFQERIDFLSQIDWTGIDLGLYGGTDDVREEAGLVVLDDDYGVGKHVTARMHLTNAARQAWWKTGLSAAPPPNVAAARALLPYIRGGFLRNTRTAALYRQAKIGLNFHRTSKGYGGQAHITHAESLNPRCYELAATRCYFVTDHRAEADDVFGDALDTFASPRECEALIRRALDDPGYRMERANACKAAVKHHSWVERAEDVLRALRLSDESVRGVAS